MRKVLILGSNGFIGRSLTSAVLENGGAEITGFGRSLSTVSHRNFRFIQGSFEDQEAVREALQDQDIVYHLISQTIPSSSWTNPMAEVERNLLPSIKLIELAAASGVKKVCFASSGGTVYGLNDSVSTEESPTDPFSPYGIIKRTLESFLLYGRHRFGTSFEIFRISNAYGEGQNVSAGLGFINTALESIVKGRPVIVYGDGENIRDFIYAGDVGRLLGRSVERDLAISDIYNVNSNCPVSLNNLLDLIREVTGLDFAVEYRPNRQNDNKKVILDNAKMKDHFEPFMLTSLNDGIMKTYNYIKDRSNYVTETVR